MSPTPERGRAAGPRPLAPEQRVAPVVRDHTSTLLRLARRHSLSPDDAEDAVQRALEIYVKRLDRVDPETELAWLKVVVKHEAMAIRRGRRDLAPDGDWDADHHEAAQRGIHERTEAAERAARSAEALRTLKPDEALALLLKAEGHSYQEIAQRLRWSYDI